MADAKKVQQSLPESSVLKPPKTEIDDEFEDPTPPASPQRPLPWEEQRWKNILSKEELKEQCKRCKEMGHSFWHCPYPFYYIEEPGVNGSFSRWKAVLWQPVKGIYRCSRCGRRGHNRRTCHGPVFY